MQHVLAMDCREHFDGSAMKLLLCYPSQRVSFQGIKARPMVGPPLGILSIAAQARASDWAGSVEIYDARLGARFHRDSDGDLIFGDTEQDIFARLQSANADVIGISNMFTSQIGQAYRLADIARAASPSSTIVIGGAHVTVYPLEALERGSIDYVVMGEGEDRMVALLKAISSGAGAAIQGVVGGPEDLHRLKPNPKAPIGFIEPLDRLALPAYDLVDLDAYFSVAARGYSPRYREWGKKPMSLLTSRGCPHQCVFCSIQTTMGYKFRHHSLDYISGHIRHLIDQYGVDFIHFEDDNFTHEPDRYDRIVDFLLTLKPKIKWDTPNGVRGDTWTFERVMRAKESGCQFLTVAIESAVQRVVDHVVRKRLDLAKVDDMMTYCKEAGLRLHAFYIIGFPGETVDDMKETIDYALDRYRRYGVTPFLQPLIPIPGTEVHDSIMEQGLHEGIVLTQYNQVRTQEFDPKIVQNLYKIYLRDRMKIFAIRTVTSKRDFFYNTRLVANYPQAVVHAFRNAANASG